MKLSVKRFINRKRATALNGYISSRDRMVKRLPSVKEDRTNLAHALKSSRSKGRRSLKSYRQVKVGPANPDRMYGSWKVHGI